MPGPSASRLACWEKLGLAALLAATFAAHAALRIEGFGEQDAARLCNDAFIWHRTGRLRIELADYRPWTSPLALHALKTAFDAGLGIRSVPAVVNWLNVLATPLALLALYLAARRLAGPAAAMAGCVLYALVPSFWVAGLYGMPHLPSFAAFLFALLAFRRSLWARGRSYVAWVGVSGALLAVAAVLKADVVLLGGAFLGVMLCARRTTWGHVAAAAAVGLVAGLATLFYAKAIQPPEASLARVGADLGERLPLRLWGLVSQGNRRITVSAFGPVLFWASAGGLVCCLASRRHLRLALLALLWSVPPQVVWGVKFGNSARHMMAPACPLVLLVGVALCFLLRGRRQVALAVGALAVANFFSTSPRASTVVPSTRLVRSAGAIQADAAHWHAAGRAFAELDAEKKLLLGGAKNAYILYEVLASARDFRFTGRGHELRVVNDRGEAQLVDWRYVSRAEARRLAPQLEAQGWHVWSAEYQLRPANSLLPRGERLWQRRKS
ncbi:MAG: glycosyltransferase family 39 protein [Candidatus Brocadiia bacterium]